MKERAKDIKTHGAGESPSVELFEMESRYSGTKELYEWGARGDRK